MASPLSNPNSPGAHSGREFEEPRRQPLSPARLAGEKGAYARRQGCGHRRRPRNQRYIIECKVASEGRPDRLVPLLSQAILQARAYALAFPEPAAPLAVVGAPAISPSAAKSLVSFLSQFAPDVAVGILDREGFARGCSKGTSVKS